MEHPTHVEWRTSSRSMDNPIRKNCVRIGSPEGTGERFLGDSKDPDAGAFRLPAGELTALLRTAGA